MTYRLNASQIKQLADPLAITVVPWEVTQAFGNDGMKQAKVFHIAFNMTVTNDWSAIPPVSERLLRGRLLIEEVFETLEAMGLQLVHSCNGGEYYEALNEFNYEVAHVEGSRYDPIETADGLADIKVICNGTSVAFGIPQEEVDNEVFASNMSKLDLDGKPIHNRCMYDGKLTSPCNEDPCVFLTGQDQCCNTTHYPDPSKPVGKVLKPANHTPANIALLFKRYTSPFNPLEPENES